MEHCVLIVEDDTETLEHIASVFRDQGWQTFSSRNGAEALQHAFMKRFDVIVLDRNLPGLDGLSALKALRAAGSTVPVIILSALAHVDERVRGLHAGSDDYMVKPFDPTELIARAEVLLRKREDTSKQTALSCADLRLDLLSRRVTRGDTEISLLPREFRLLEYLLRHKDQTITRSMLMHGVWGYENAMHSSAIDTHISRLRKKIEENLGTPLIHTVRGVGFRMSAHP